jgi:hypothetical protein
MIQLGVQEEHIYGKPLLSDRGAAVLSYGRRFRRHFHCVWHLLENYGSNKWFTTFVRRIAFATCKNDFDEQISRIVEDLTVLAEQGNLNNAMFERFSAEFGIIRDDEGFRFDQERAGVGQSLWARTENGGVTTCTAHSERIHREANERCPRSPNLLGRMALLIRIVTERFESANKFPAEQARKELRKLKKMQKASGLTPALRCPNQRCGWQAVYARRYGLPDFPCVHTVGSGPEVTFPRRAPIDRLFDIEPQVFHDRLPDGVGDFVAEDPITLRRVMFEHLSYHDDSDTTTVRFFRQWHSPNPDTQTILLVLGARGTSRKVAGSIPDDVIEFFQFT